MKNKGKSLAMALLVAVAAGLTSAQAQGVDAMLDINRFRVTDSTTMLELNMLVAGSSVTYQKAGKGKRQAKVAVNIEIADEAGIRAADKLALLSPVISDTARYKPDFQTVKRYLLRNGEYTLTIATTDANSEQPESKVKVPVSLNLGDKSNVQLSDILLLSSFKKAEAAEVNTAFQRSGYELIPYPSSFFPERINRLSFYSEIYRTNQIAGENAPLVITYGLYPENGKKPLTAFSRFSKQQALPVNVLLTELDITELPSGNYRMFVEVRDRNNKLLASQHKLIQRSNPAQAQNQLASYQKVAKDEEITFAASVDSTRLGFYLLAHQPIANTVEMDFIQGLVKSGNIKDQRRYLEHFWKRRAPETPEQSWLEYQKNIDYTENSFATKNYRGYMTDRGRVYLQYGPPNLIHNEKTDVKRNPNNTDVRPYQIWHYYNIGQFNNKIFVFVQNNLGNENLRLTHSDMRGEISNPDWRKEVQQKFSGSRYDRQ